METYLFFAVTVAVHVGQLLETSAPPVQVVKVLLFIFYSKSMPMNQSINESNWKYSETLEI